MRRRKKDKEEGRRGIIEGQKPGKENKMKEGRRRRRRNRWVCERNGTEQADNQTGG
jgi:hypothetical protein